MTMTLRSTAFANGQKIPVKYTRDGDNLSPPLSWSGAPSGVQGYALIVEDPDAPSGTFRHWAIYDIPPDITALPEGAGPHSVKGRDGTRQGVNDFGNPGYDGPEPPHRHGVHHYHFRLAALDVPSLNVPERADVRAVWRAAEKHALATAEIVGTYER